MKSIAAEIKKKLHQAESDLDPHEHRPPEKDKILEALCGDRISRKFYHGKPVERGWFDQVTMALRGDDATPLRVALLRQHQQDPTRLADFVDSILVAVHHIALDAQPAQLADVERLEPVDAVQPKRRGAQRERTRRDLWEISGLLPTSSGITAMLKLRFRDQWRFRRAFKALLGHWQQVYKAGSQWRRADIAETLGRDKNQKRSAIAFATRRRGGRSAPESGPQFETAFNTANRDLRRLTRKFCQLRPRK